MKVGDLIKLKYPRKPQHGGSGVIVENDKKHMSPTGSLNWLPVNWFRVIWTDSQTSLTGESWLKEQQIEVLNERTSN